MILTPGHGALPSGHATEAFMVAYILWRLRRTVDSANDHRWCEQLMRQASRVAINRTVAGVHFPVDSAAGQVLGLTLGRYFVLRCTNVPAATPAPMYRAWSFLGDLYGHSADFDWTLLFDTSAVSLANDGMPAALPGFVVPMSTPTPTATGSDALKWLWDLAAGEQLFT
jgi:hypothetical protein